jgi:hypothetical protein
VFFSLCWNGWANRPNSGRCIYRKLRRTQALLRTNTHTGAFTVEGAPAASRRAFSRPPPEWKWVLVRKNCQPFQPIPHFFFRFQSSRPGYEGRGDLRSNISATRGHQDTRCGLRDNLVCIGSTKKFALLYCVVSTKLENPKFLFHCTGPI